MIDTPYLKVVAANLIGGLVVGGGYLLTLANPLSDQDHCGLTTEQQAGIQMCAKAVLSSTNASCASTWPCWGPPRCRH